MPTLKWLNQFRYSKADEHTTDPKYNWFVRGGDGGWIQKGGTRILVHVEDRDLLLQRLFDTPRPKLLGAYAFWKQLIEPFYVGISSRDVVRFLQTQTKYTLARPRKATKPKAATPGQLMQLSVMGYRTPIWSGIVCLVDCCTLKAWAWAIRPSENPVTLINERFPCPPPKVLQTMPFLSSIHTTAKVQTDAPLTSLLKFERTLRQMLDTLKEKTGKEECIGENEEYLKILLRNYNKVV